MLPKLRARLTENGKRWYFYQENTQDKQYLQSYLRRAALFMKYGKEGEGTNEAIVKGVHDKYLPQTLESILEVDGGLLDRDGKSIYENDIVDVYHEETENTRPEHRNLVAFRYVATAENGYGRMMTGEQAQRKVVGSTWLNPELEKL